MGKDRSKTQRFTKDDDDEKIPRRPFKRAIGSVSKPKPIYTKCQCGGNMKPRGSIGTCGLTSARCTGCGRREYTKHYKGRAGLVECY